MNDKGLASVLAENEKLRKQRKILVAALREAKETIRIWHGEPAWDIYDFQSPEMKTINAVLEKEMIR